MATVIQQHPVMEALFWQTGAEGGRGGNVGTGMGRRGGEDRGNKTRVDRQRENILMYKKSCIWKKQAGGESRKRWNGEKGGNKKLQNVFTAFSRSAVNHFLTHYYDVNCYFSTIFFVKININKSKKKKRRHMELQHLSRFLFWKRKSLYLVTRTWWSLVKPKS